MGEHNRDEDPWDEILAWGAVLIFILVGVVLSGYILVSALT